MDQKNYSNIGYIVKNGNEDIREDIIEFIHNCALGEPGIIYCRTMAECDSFVDLINYNDLRAVIYNPSEWSEIQEQWNDAEFDVLVAISDNKMKIFKKDIRYIFHETLPKSAIIYHEESGQGGLDGKETLSVVYFQWYDVIKYR